MSTIAISSINSKSGGERRVLGAAPASVSVAAASSTTDALIAADALLEAWENAGSTVFGIRGDGRLAVPLQSPSPAVLHDSDFWIELDLLGAPTLLYRYAGATYTLGGGGVVPGGSGLSLPCLTNGLQKGTVVRTLLNSGVMKSDVAYCGAGAVAAGAHRAVGILNADVPDLVTPVEILLSGMRIDLTGPQIDFLTGGITGVLIPSQPYFVSASGRWSTTPLQETGAEAVIPLGTAVTETSLLVLIGPTVVL